MPLCPVCGYPKLQSAPRSSSGGGSYEICPSCGFQFGVDDDDKGGTYAQWREKWIKGGMKWQSKGAAAPESWDPKKQLSALKTKPKAKSAAKKKR